MTAIQPIIERAFETRDQISPDTASAEVRDAVEAALSQLDSGAVRVAEKTATGWQVNEWLKKAVLLSFRLTPNQRMRGGASDYYDKVR
jgi:2,3,4,5-tetrahydropyridine-2,6-dicarboxylate N-succinyltransferase (EC 2.3.1.117)